MINSGDDIGAKVSSEVAVSFIPPVASRHVAAVLNLGHGAARCTLFSIPRFPREPLTIAVRLATRAFVSITTTVYPGARSSLYAHRRRANSRDTN